MLPATATAVHPCLFSSDRVSWSSLEMPADRERNIKCLAPRFHMQAAIVCPTLQDGGSALAKVHGGIADMTEEA
jgi:hypothetical protein